MEQLKLDFNSRNVRDEVRIGPAALERHRAVLERLHPGDGVLVVDADGDRCFGILRADPSRPIGHRFSVAMDWSTWTDGPGLAAPPQRLVAAG